MNQKKIGFFKSKKRKENVDADMVNGKSVATIKKDKRQKIGFMIFSALLAFAVWMYASSVTVIDFSARSLPVTLKRVSAVESKGYKVEYNTNLIINYTIRGTVFSISQLPDSGVDIYADLSTVNLSEITDVKIVQLPLILDLPSDITCPEKSQEYIEVVITKITTE